MPVLRVSIIVIATLVQCSPLQQVQAQYSPASQITAVRKAKLVLVVTAGPVLRAYSKPDPNHPDSGGDYSEVVFEIVEVLKGTYHKKDISVLYAAHMSIDDKSKWILIVDDKTDLLSGGDKRYLAPLLKKWPEKYVSNSEWLIEANNEELKSVREWIVFTKDGQSKRGRV